jgi:hypothetical protein
MKPENPNRAYRLALVLLVVFLIVGLRFIAPRSDPFPQLDWSAGLMTDEGFNIHNARNLILFGQTSTDEYNNMLFSPLYHFTQVGVFRIFGVGSVQARMISVVCSLLALVFLWAALRRAFDSRIAFTAVIFLGLDHTSLLYNRMALMDTPATLFSAMALYAFVRAVTRAEDVRKGSGRWGWLIACGALIALSVTVRTVGVYLLAAPFVALGVQSFRRGESSSSEPDRQYLWKEFMLLSIAIVMIFALYYLLWYQPHHAELTAMSHYYGARQIPRSPALLATNIYNATLAPRGLSTYLFHHTPVVFVLALLGLVLSLKRRMQAVEVYLIVWLLFGCSLLAVSSYSPSRYYVTIYPALAAVAAIALWRLKELWLKLQQTDPITRLVRAVLIWFLVYHAVEITLQHYGVQGRAWGLLVLYGLPTVLCVLDFAFLGLEWLNNRFNLKPLLTGPRLAAVVMVLWLVFNAFWMFAWLYRLDYSQYRMSQWLAQNVPAGSVLIGDVAPGVCLDNNFITVYVEPRLWNDVMPVENMGKKYPDAARYIVMDDRWKDRYWVPHYPQLVTPERRIKLARVLNWEVGVYAVEP